MAECAEMGTPAMQSPEDRVPLDPKDRPAPDSRLIAYRFPPEPRSARERLRWTREAETYLFERLDKARGAYRAAAQSLMDRLIAEDPSRYGRRQPDRPLAFGDLSEEEQHFAAMEFAQEHPDLASSSEDARAWLAGAQTLKSRNDFVLSAFFVENWTPSSADVHYLYLPCVGP